MCEDDSFETYTIQKTEKWEVQDSWGRTEFEP